MKFSVERELSELTVDELVDNGQQLQAVQGQFIK